MKRLTIIALLAASMAHAGWWRTYGGSEWDVARCIQITSDGNYIISGAKNNNLWLIKTDTSGDIIWDKTYGRSDGARSRWLEETSDGGYIIAPRTPSLLKVNAQGDSVWAYDYGMYSYCVQETSDGGYVTIGGDYGYGLDYHLIVVKTDSEGDSIWRKTYSTSDLNTGFFVRETFDGGYIITGLNGPSSEEYESLSLWLLKIDSNGSIVWSKTYGTESDREYNGGFYLRQTSDSGYAIVGHRDFGERGLWFLKTDSLGDTLWTKTYTSPIGGEGYCIQEMDDGYIICGTTTQWFFYSQVAATDGTDLWLLKTDKNGDTLWTRFYGGEESDMGFCVQQTADTGFIVVGYTQSFGAGQADIYLLKTDSLGLLGVAEKPIPESTKKWNIATSIGGAIVLRYSDCPGGLRVSTFDVCGRNIDAVFVTGQSGNLTLGEDYPAGVYFIQIRNDNQIRTARVVLVH